MTKRSDTVRLHFLGASGTVTGSKFLLEHNGRRILFDCGLFQGRKELRLRNWDEPSFDPAQLDCVVLTHAHIDHTGYLPLIVRRGFKGPIHCTAATRDLLKLLLPDSAYLQEEEARYHNKEGSSKHHPAKPLYSGADADRTLDLLRVIERDVPVAIVPGITVLARCAGHILGSCSLFVEAAGRGITFSGDIGRFGTPILPDPQPTTLGDLVLCESTYGDRMHAVADIEQELADAVTLAVRRNGALLVPAFAVGRTQNLIYFLAKLEREGRIPVLPVYVDSPMAIDATRLYRNHRNDYDDEANAVLEQGQTPLLTQNISFCRSREESKQINGTRGARIIISASGMATGGRVLHHLMHLLPQESTTLLFVGYQAEGTRGRLLQSGAGEVKIFGRYVQVRAGVTSISGLSAHGDQGELIRWLESCSGSPQHVKIIHGEPEAATVFSAALKKRFGWSAVPAKHLEVVEI